MQLKTIPEDFVVTEKATHKLREYGPFLLCELTKRNLSTERAIHLVAEALGLQRKLIGYAGAKDARALTRQFISIKAERSVVKNIANKQFTLRVLGFLPDPIGLGNLEKNGFEIVIRKISDEQLSPIAKIPNYFDEQRFSTANAKIGKCILQKNFKEAVAILGQTDEEAHDRAQQYLEQRPGDYVGVLRLVPKHTLLMYVHAYQSLLFNEVLSRYLLASDPSAAVVDGPVPIVVPTKEVDNVSIPIFGFGTEHHPVFGQWYEEILAREGLEPRDFVVRSMPFLTVEGTDRHAFFGIEDLTGGALEDDDIFPGFKKQRLTFTLPKSCYATMVVKCLYRTGNLRGDPDT